MESLTLESQKNTTLLQTVTTTTTTTTTITQRFTDRKREIITSTENRRFCDYYIISLLKYIFTFKTSIIERDAFLNFFNDRVSWGVFGTYVCNWASRFNIQILRAKAAKHKRHFFLQDPFVEKILARFPEWKKCWTHTPESGTYAIYLSSSQYERYLRSSRRQMNPKAQKLETLEFFFDMVYNQINKSS